MRNIIFFIIKILFIITIFMLPVVALPDTFDWHDKEGTNWMTSVKSQYDCGSCWAFSTLGAVEAQYNILFNDPNYDLDLSEQYLVSNCSDAGDCCGGHTDLALSYIKTDGVPDQDCMPYNDSGCSCYPSGTCGSGCNYKGDQGCSNSICTDRCSNWPSRLKYIDGYKYLSNDKEKIKDHLYNIGPVVASMYWEGIVDTSFPYLFSCDPDTGLGSWHAIIITGYNEVEDYWVVKNSHGEKWWNDGYFKVGFGECSIEKEVYGISLTSDNGVITIYNDGNEGLIVTDISSPENWISASSTGFSISPGSSKDITVNVNSLGKSTGVHRGNLNIYSNDPDEDIVTVEIIMIIHSSTLTNTFSTGSASEYFEYTGASNKTVSIIIPKDAKLINASVVVEEV